MRPLADRDKPLPVWPVTDTGSSLGVSMNTRPGVPTGKVVDSGQRHVPALGRSLERLLQDGRDAALLVVEACVVDGGQKFQPTRRISLTCRTMKFETQAIFVTEMADRKPCDSVRNHAIET